MLLPRRQSKTAASMMSPPFGYNFIEAPEPAPGDPILSETDAQFLASFFDNVGSGADAYSFFSFGEGVSGNLIDQLPGNLMGSTTSLGPLPSLPGPSIQLPGDLSQQFFISQDIINQAQHPHMRPVAPTIPLGLEQPRHHHQQQHRPTADVIEAAQVLQNGSAPRTSGNAMFVPQVMAQPRGLAASGHLRHQPMDEFRQSERRGLSAPGLTGNEHDNTLESMILGNPSGSIHQVPITMRANPPTDVQWGSDIRFSGHASQPFVPQSSRETLEAMEQERLRTMQCLQVDTSANNTRPGSADSSEQPFSPIGTAHSRKASELNSVEDHIGAPPSKRRKSKPVKSEDEEDEEEDEFAVSTPVPASKAPRKRAPKVDRTNSSSQSPGSANGSSLAPNGAAAAGTPPTKRRKSANAASKPPRETLSEEQKRENHIKSEQKRRTVIKDCYDELKTLIPGLSNGSLSKSAMIAMASEWVDDLVSGNTLLEAQLAALEKR